MESEPRFWGSWKGRVVKAIAVDGAKTWSEIRDITGLYEKSLNTALAELYELGILDKTVDGIYSVSPEIEQEYQKILREPEHPEAGVKAPSYAKFSEEKQKEQVSYIKKWRELKGLTFPMKSNHFFLEGRYLDELSKELICKAQSEVLVVNPFIDSCDLSNTLREAHKNDVVVNLITRPPKTEKSSFEKDKEEYHKVLRAEGIKMTYNKAVHAKLIVVDRVIAVSSSMNFYSGSSGGASWEAGLVSMEKTVVESVVDSILSLLEKPESKELL